MDLREVVENYKQFQIPSISIICEKAKQHSKTCLLIVIILFFVFIYLIQQIPHWQVAQFGIANPKDLADAENSYRATLAQILGGIAVGIGIYYTWQRNNIAQEGQITERFTRAVDQLGAVNKDGNPAIEIRLGGIYALERIANESDKDYWPIMEILTAYVKRNASIEDSKVREQDKVRLDIQAVLTVIGRCKYAISDGVYYRLDMSKIFVAHVDLQEASFEDFDFDDANFEEAHLPSSVFEGVCFSGANLKKAILAGANLEEAILSKANLEGSLLAVANLKGAYLNRANLKGANLEWANLEKADLEEANFEDANLRKARHLTIDQLSKAKTLYRAELDPELEEELKAKYTHLFVEPKDEP